MEQQRFLKFFYLWIPFHSVYTELETWVVVSKLDVESDQTFFKKGISSFGKLCMAFLSFSCFSLTIRKQCANWLTLKKYKVKRTNARTISVQNETVQDFGNLTSTSATERTLSDWCKLPLKGWSSNKFLTEEILRETANEGPVMKHFKGNPFIVGIFKVGITALKKHPHLLCSYDDVAIIKPGIGWNELSEGVWRTAKWWREGVDGICRDPNRSYCCDIGK